MGTVFVSPFILADFGPLGIIDRKRNVLRTKKNRCRFRFEWEDLLVDRGKDSSSVSFVTVAKGGETKETIESVIL